MLNEDQEYVLQALREAWERNPKQRLCQLIVNATERNDPFYVKDLTLTINLMTYPHAYN